MRPNEPYNPFETTIATCDGATERPAVDDLLADAQRLRSWLEDAEAIGCRTDAIIDGIWGDTINADGSRHVAAKAVFLRHYLLDLIWGMEREAKGISERFRN